MSTAKTRMFPKHYRPGKSKMKPLPPSKPITGARSKADRAGK